MTTVRSIADPIDPKWGSLRAVLQHRRDELRLHVHRELPDFSAVHEVSDRKEDAARSEAGLVEAVLEAAELAELADIDAALRRMDEGGFGQCIRCGEAISPARLRANPSTPRCMTCQSAHERGEP